MPYLDLAHFSLLEREKAPGLRVLRLHCLGAHLRRHVPESEGNDRIGRKQPLLRPGLNAIVGGKIKMLLIHVNATRPLRSETKAERIERCEPEEQPGTS